MRRQSFSLSLTTSAKAADLYALLADVPAWVSWAPLVSHATFVRQGTPDPTGAGAVRRVGGLGVISVDEEILEAVPGRKQRYTATRGLPVSAYDATVEFDDAEGRTRLTWTSTFTAKPAVLGPVLKVLLRAAIGRLARGLVVAAESAQRA